MANSPAGSLDRAFEELIQRVVEASMASVRGEIQRLEESTMRPAGGVPSPFSVAPTAAPAGNVASLNQAVNAILAPTGQTDIMAAALKCSADVSGAAALLVRRGDNFTTWRSEGLSADEANQLKSMTVSGAAPGPFKDMCDRLRSITQPVSGASWPAGVDALASGSQSICLLPILVAGKVVAAIVAGAGNSQDEPARLEIVARVAGLSLETSNSRVAASAPGPQSAAAAPAHAAQPAAEPGPTPPPVAADESRGSFAHVAPAAASGPNLPPPPDVESLAEPDQDSHKKAHRFARVAVQDLLSYHKAKIAEGRNNHNLYDVLREDIEKTRENYQKKFSATAAASFDYLHYEMVCKLAGNDLEVLGRNYPGPVGV